MGKRPRDSVEREIMDIIPERFDGDLDGGRGRGGHTRLILSIALGVLALAALGVAGRHLLVGEGQQVQADASVPVIKPDDKPIKTKPEDRGGMDVPNQDKLVYQDLGKGDSQGDNGTANEKLLPPAEKPQMPAMKATGSLSSDGAASAALPPAGGGAGSGDVPLPPAVAGNDTAAVPPPAASSGSSSGSSSGTMPAAPAPRAAAPVEPPPSSAANVAPGKGGTSNQTAPAKAQQLASAAPAAPPPKHAAAASKSSEPPANAPSASGGSYQVQLAAMKSEADAQAAWKRALAANKDLLNGLSDEVVRADLGAKGVYFRLRAGPLDEAAAKSLCAKLVERKQVCIVARKS